MSAHQHFADDVSTSDRIRNVMESDTREEPRLFPSKMRLQVSCGHPLGVVTLGLTTFALGLMLAHIDSMWFRDASDGLDIAATVANGGVLLGQHHAQGMFALLLQWFSMGSLFIAGVLQALNNDATATTAYFMNGMGLGAIGYMLPAASTGSANAFHGVGYVMYALFYFNTLITLAHIYGNSQTRGYKLLFTLMYMFLALFFLIAGLRFTDAIHHETKDTYDRTGDYAAGLFGLITSFICAILAIPLLCGKTLAFGITVKRHATNCNPAMPAAIR